MDGARNADKRRPCAWVPRESELMTIEEGADTRIKSSAHEVHTLPLLLAAAAAPEGAAAAAKLFMNCRRGKARQRWGSPPNVSYPEKQSSRVFREKKLKAGFDVVAYFFPF